MRLTASISVALAFVAGVVMAPTVARLLPSAFAQVAPPLPALEPMIIDIGALKDADLGATAFPDLRAKGLVTTANATL